VSLGSFAGRVRPARGLSIQAARFGQRRRLFPGVRRWQAARLPCCGCARPQCSVLLLYLKVLAQHAKDVFSITQVRYFV
jgi:hypothetical protein